MTVYLILHPDGRPVQTTDGFPYTRTAWTASQALEDAYETFYMATREVLREGTWRAWELGNPRAALNWSPGEKAHVAPESAD